MRCSIKIQSIKQIYFFFFLFIETNIKTNWKNCAFILSFFDFHFNVHMYVNHFLLLLMQSQSLRFYIKCVELLRLKKNKKSWQVINNIKTTVWPCWHRTTEWIALNRLLYSLICHLWQFNSTNWPKTASQYT